MSMFPCSQKNLGRTSYIVRNPGIMRNSRPLAWLQCSDGLRQVPLPRHKLESPYSFACMRKGQISDTPHEVERQIYHIPKPASKVQLGQQFSFVVVVFFPPQNQRKTFSKYVYVPLHKILHCDQFVRCKYSIVGCISVSVIATEFFSNVKNVLVYF